MPKTRWTAEEYEILDRVYPIESSRGGQALLPHRTMEAVKQAVRDRNLKIIGRRPWSAEETAIVLANYPTLGGRATAALLQDRLQQDVAVHANIHGVYRVRIREAA